MGLPALGSLPPHLCPCPPGTCEGTAVTGSPGGPVPALLPFLWVLSPELQGLPTVCSWEGELLPDPAAQILPAERTDHALPREGRGDICSGFKELALSVWLAGLHP